MAIKKQDRNYNNRMPYKLNLFYLQEAKIKIEVFTFSHEKVILKFLIKTVLNYTCEYICLQSRACEFVHLRGKYEVRLKLINFTKSFHLRCHGEMLFKCGYCVFFHWQKRTAERHVSDQHPDKKLFVRSV